MSRNSLIVRNLGLRDYAEIWHAMQDFTDNRNDQSSDELWCLEHNPVFTQGQAGKEEHLLATGDIPVIPVDRGGQVTYHGPGQLVIYTLIDIRRSKLSVRQLVTSIENAVVVVLKELGIDAHSDRNAPGVYLETGDKICSIGLRIRRGKSFHGLALNVNPDLSPFDRINPCGFTGLKVTSINKQGANQSIQQVCELLVSALTKTLGYNNYQWCEDNVAIEAE